MRTSAGVSAVLQAGQAPEGAPAKELSVDTREAAGWDVQALSSAEVNFLTLACIVC